MHSEQHISDRDLLSAADGELSPRAKNGVDDHLRHCWTCRERMASIETTVAGFVRARNASLVGRLPSAPGPRALLRASMAELSAEPGASKGFPRMTTAAGAFASVAVLVLVLFQTTVNAEGPRPRSGLTPGESRVVTIAEVCRNPEAEVVTRDIPLETRNRVFAAYGIAPGNRDQFEVDYLITPDLGGTETLRNLWPQPYSVRWNAKVKDKLEQRLHQLVCSGQLDLATARHEIAADWIGAYRKYVGLR